ncbi:MAG: CPBP family glutamic-type intramembrane protease [Candidatus Ozemobacteraceae bacterium]
MADAVTDATVFPAVPGIQEIFARFWGQIFGQPKKILLEAGIVFLLLLPFYAYFLRTPEFPRTFGFFYLAGICVYILWFSPNRNPAPEARKSLMEVPILTGSALFFEWAIIPAGPVGRFAGQVLLGFCVVYILFLSSRFHGDRSTEWGIGSPTAMIGYLRNGQNRFAALGALFLGGICVVSACLFAHDLVAEILRGMLRRAFGYRQAIEVSTPVLAMTGLCIYLFFVFFVIRFDNLREAGIIVGAYFLGLVAVVAIGGYVYIYLLNSGWVEFAPRKGLTSMGAYVLWGTLQELLFLSYFNTRIRKGISSPLLSALLTAVIFSIFHLTAYTLMFLCFLVGIIWALIFQVAPNLFLIGICHGISAGFGSFFAVQGMKLIRIKASVGPFNM